MLIPDYKISAAKCYDDMLLLKYSDINSAKWKKYTEICSYSSQFFIFLLSSCFALFSMAQFTNFIAIFHINFCAFIHKYLHKRKRSHSPGNS